ncbi:uncharacterized protein LOC133068237 [Dama dama]|uniref:uncharacterized protein LOC133068237 n=1 Tax=Dama dama TaxID=30532 RepID=UPI002A35CCAE|nr:uncharacterized protein LOC133068237 [Dama dama]
MSGRNGQCCCPEVTGDVAVSEEEPPPQSLCQESRARAWARPAGQGLCVSEGLAPWPRGAVLGDRLGPYPLQGSGRAPGSRPVARLRQSLRSGLGGPPLAEALRVLASSLPPAVSALSPTVDSVTLGLSLLIAGESAGSPACLFPATHTLSSQPDARALGACGADARPRSLPLRAPSHLPPGSKVALRAARAPRPETGFSVGSPRDP